MTLMIFSSAPKFVTANYKIAVQRQLFASSNKIRRVNKEFMQNQFTGDQKKAKTEKKRFDYMVFRKRQNEQVERK